MSERRQDAWNGAPPSTLGTLIYMLFGPIAWAVQLTTVYMAHTLVCALGGADAIASVLVVVVSAAIAVGLIFAMATGDKLAAMLGVTAHAEGRATYDGIFRVLAILSLIAVIWSAVTAFFVVAC